MKLSRTGVIIALFVFGGLKSLFAQELEEANKFFSDYQYDFAIPHYLKAIDKRPTTEAMERLADCYRMVNDSRNAETWYNKTLQNDSTRLTARFYYAEVLRSNAKYDEAIKSLNIYLRRAPEDEARIKRLLESCTVSKEWMNNPNGVSITNETTLNSKFSEFCPIPYKKGVLFTSDRVVNKKGKVKDEENYIFGWTGNPYLKMFYAEYKTGQWSAALPLNEPVNSTYHNGPASYDASHKLLCFSRTVRQKNPVKLTPLRLKNNDPVNRKQLFFAREVADGKWDQVRSFKYNNPANYSLQHPAFSLDGKYLYFSSDMPGGYGKFDLYYSEKLNDTTWSTPVNLGPAINTAEDEGFPSVSKDNMLYFSSAGHLGMGGMDIYSAVGSTTNWKEVTNLQYPFNSSKDDFGILFLKEKELGFISSNRDGGQGGDDILRFKITTPSCVLSGIVLDKVAHIPLAGAQVVLTDKKGQIQELIADSLGAFHVNRRDCEDLKISAFKPGFSTVSIHVKGGIPNQKVKLELEKGYAIILEGKVIDKTTGKPFPKALIAITETAGEEGDKFTTDKNGEFTYPLAKQKKYKIIALAEGYLPDKTFIDTYPIRKTTTLTTTLYLDRIEMNKTVVLRDIYYDRNKSNIRKDAETALEEVLNLMNLNPNLKLEIGSHTDSRAKEAYNMKLSQRRAQAVVQYLTSKGIAKNRLIPKGYGETMLLNGCKSNVKCSEEEHQLNRRTEFKVVGVLKE